jgi:hypothetical protein
MRAYVMQQSVVSAQRPSPFPDGTTSQSTKPASGQVAGYLPPTGEGIGIAVPHQLNEELQSLHS